MSADSNNADVSGKLLNSLIEAVAPPHSSSPATECSTLPLSSLSTIAMHAKIRFAFSHNTGPVSTHYTTG